ncbi:MAG: hypothetical protein ACLGIA_10190 [Actinomycetes bacterium]
MRRVVALGAAALLVAVLGAFAGVWLATSRSAQHVAVVPASVRLPERLPTLVAFVEGRLGAQFTTEPRVEMLDDDAFVDALLEPSDEGGAVPSKYDDFASTAFALGLAGDPDDLASEMDQSFTDGVVGFYDHVTHRLAVRGTEWFPFVETTVVHELVHALQDQQVDLRTATERTRMDDESYDALTALLEGHATVVESDWIDEQGRDYEDGYLDSQPAIGDGGPVDEPLVDVLGALPYDLGFEAVTSLEATSSDPDAVWNVLRTPPTTLEQVWDLARRRPGATSFSEPAAVAPPAAPARAHLLDRGTFGVHLLTLLTMPYPDDWYWLEDDPVNGWAGDRYSTWVEGDERVCTQVDVAMDDAKAAETLTDALRTWVDDGGSVRGGEGTSLVLERCATLT